MHNVVRRRLDKLSPIYQPLKSLYEALNKDPSPRRTLPPLGFWEYMIIWAALVAGNLTYAFFFAPYPVTAISHALDRSVFQLLPIIVIWYVRR